MAGVIQINPDGSTVVDAEPAKVEFSSQEQIIKSAFTSQGWALLDYVGDELKRTHRIKVEKSGETIEAVLYVFAPLNYSAPRGDKSEKRVQLGTPTGADKAKRDSDFALPRDGSPRCALLGIYKRGNLTLFGAWPSSNYVGHGTNPNIWIKGRLLAAAARVGIAQEKNASGHLLCAFVPDMLPAYLHGLAWFHGATATAGHAVEDSSIDDEVGENDITELPKNDVPADMPRNRIVYGAPGTGKSHKIDAEVNAHFGATLLHERVTFHPDYTYGQLVGSYRPVPIYREGSVPLLAADKVSDAGKYEPLIDYAFVPGPFLRLLVRASKNPNHNFVLVIEELNRANAPAVFGEVFQLLDRDSKGVGKFSVVMPTEAGDYLRSHDLPSSVQLPANLYLWATMNSADQGVMPLDAAFKRRWTFEYVPLNASEQVTAGWMIHLAFLGRSVPWNAFRAAINDHLRKRDVPEDRLLGPFFMRQDELASGQAFTNKLLLYLRDDVVRHNPEALFKGASLSYGALAEAYGRGEAIFADGIDFGAVDQGG